MKFPGGGGGGNMQGLMKQAQQMQQRMQDAIAQVKVEGTAGGGMVTISMDGQKHVTAVRIDPEAAGDAEMLQDLVLAACNDAQRRVEDELQKKMGGLGLPPGLF